MSLNCQLQIEHEPQQIKRNPSPQQNIPTGRAVTSPRYQIISVKSQPQTQEIKCKTNQMQTQLFSKSYCCARHIGDVIKCKKDEQKQLSFSIDTQLLEDFEPINISTDPVFEFKPKPEVDLLGEANIKIKKYEQLLQKCEKENQSRIKKEQLEKVKLKAKLALEKNKKVKMNHKQKWGHNVYNNQEKKCENSQQKDKLIIQKQKGQKSREKLKPISQRIAEYKKRESEKLNSSELNKKKKEVNIEQNRIQIEQNAKQILKDLRQEQLKKQEDRKLVQAKIRALHIKSLEHIKSCKKKKTDLNEDFNFGDSQYSTFEARAQGRKKQKKNRKNIKQKKVQQMKEKIKHQNEAKKSIGSNKKVQKLGKTSNQKGLVLIQKQTNEINDQMESKNNKFYFWNIPIRAQDVQKLQNIQKDLFLNVDRFNYKQTKTFREQANEYLNNKLKQKMMTHDALTKQKQFDAEVQIKKRQLIQQFNNLEKNKVFEEPFWNEDQIFKSNILQNFHFYQSNFNKDH